MADMTRVRTPLEIAAASPDPKVRRMALRRMEMEPEMKRLDAFFALYADEPEPAAAPAKPQRNASIANAAKADKPDPLHDTVRAILLEHGPLDGRGLYERYMQRVPDDTAQTQEKLRMALVRRKERIGRVSASDSRYWPVGVPLPTNGVNGAAIA